MIKYINLLFLIFIIVGCSKKVNVEFDGKNYYQTTNGVLLAFDGVDWYQLRHYSQSFGEMNGQNVGIGESWIKLTGENAGSHVSTWHRDQSTLNNTNLPPVFIRY